MLRSPLQSNHYRMLEEYNIQEAEGCMCFRFHKGETIFLEGMPMEYLFLVVRGKAKVCVSTENGKDFLLTHYVSRGMIGDVELMTDSYVAITSIITISEFECIGIPYQKYTGTLRANVTFLNRVGFELSKKLIRTTMSCKSTALYSAEARLSACLLEIVEDGMVNEPLTDLASIVGTSYRHMQRLMKQLCEKGVLKKTASGYQILNQDYLIGKVPVNYME